MTLPVRPISNGSATVIDPPAGQDSGDLALAVGEMRQAVTERVLAGLSGQAGAVAAALLTGERGAIAKDVLAAMRDAGLAHLLAISGLHIGLFAGILFFVSRALLALWEPVALRYPIKKWAAAVALAGTAFYLLLSGATIPTQRAFLMGGLVIMAILLDRTGISMRSVAWAAVAVLLMQPESLLGASFQMSFAAVVALVAAFEWYGLRRGRWTNDTPPRRLLNYFAGVALATLIAGLATAPFAAYNFNLIADYGLAANLLAVPMTALWIMPWGVAALALMPFGLEAVALNPMGLGHRRRHRRGPHGVVMVRCGDPAAGHACPRGDYCRRWRVVAVPVAPTLALARRRGFCRGYGDADALPGAGYSDRRQGQAVRRARARR
jgi:competence protein ComEC